MDGANGMSISGGYCLIKHALVQKIEPRPQ